MSSDTENKVFDIIERSACLLDAETAVKEILALLPKQGKCKECADLFDCSIREELPRFKLNTFCSEFKPQPPEQV